MREKRGRREGKGRRANANFISVQAVRKLVDI